MRKILIPPPLTLKHPITGQDLPGESMTYHRFIDTLVLNDPAFGKGYHKIRQASRIDKLFAGSQPGNEVWIEDGDWEAVKGALESPHESNLWVAHMVRQIEPFMTLWMEAPEGTPSKN
jgi:hypothetical protein